MASLSYLEFLPMKLMASHIQEPPEYGNTMTG